MQREKVSCPRTLQGAGSRPQGVSESAAENTRSTESEKGFYTQRNKIRLSDRGQGRGVHAGAYRAPCQRSAEGCARTLLCGGAGQNGQAPYRGVQKISGQILQDNGTDRQGAVPCALPDVLPPGQYSERGGGACAVPEKPEDSSRAGAGLLSHPGNDFHLYVLHGA